MILQRLFEKSPPVEFDAEKSVLCAMMMGGKCDLSRDDFSDERHSIIFKAIQESGAPDIVSVASHLRAIGQFETIGGADYLSEVSEMVPTDASLAHHAKIVSECATKRRLIDAAGLILDAAYNKPLASSKELISSAQASIGAIYCVEDQPKNLPAVVEKQNYILDLYNLTPKEIQGIYHSLKSPTDAGKVGLKLSDACILLLAYALAGSLAGKRIVVRNDFMAAKSEHFYTNNFVLFINRSGAGKSGSSGIVQEFVENFNRSIPNGSMPARLKSNMASGPKGLILETFGTHKARIMERTVGTGPVLSPLANARKDAPPRHAITTQDIQRATDAYIAEVWANRDMEMPIIFSVDELAEKLAAIAKLSNDVLICVHASGPHTRANELTYNDVGTCYGYGHAVSIYGNVQLGLVSDLLYSTKNSASGLLGRMLPLSNGFRSDVELPLSSASQEGVAQWLANDIGSIPVNGQTANFTGQAFDGFKDRFNRPNGIEAEKIYVMAQRLMAPACLFGGHLDLLFSTCCEVLSELYEVAYDSAETARAESVGERMDGSLRAILGGLAAKGGRITIRQCLKAISSGRRDDPEIKDQVMDYFQGLQGWRTFGNRQTKIAGFEKI